MIKYQWQELTAAKPSKKLTNFKNTFGINVIARASTGKAKKVRISIYTGDYNKKVYLVGDFNKWGKELGDEFEFKQDGNFHSIETNVLKHKESYLIYSDDKFVRDPATKYFDENGNSVFWDLEDPTAYRMQSKRIDNFKRSIKILQSDLPGLIYHFRAKNGKLGKDIKTEEYFNFITESGVIEKIKDLGFNTVQFLPVSQSIDGDKWSFRYLVPFIYAINRNWGTPDDFARMVDSFHKNGIGVVLDLVISHAPHKDYKLFKINGKDIGLHKWDEVFNSNILDEVTNWGTKRYNYTDENIRKFVIESSISYLKNYGVDGFRIDNIDGILRFGDNGDGKERPYGRTILRELNTEIYSYSPKTMVNFEAHYFFGNNAKWLVQNIKNHKNALGATAYTSSRITHYLHSEFMPKSADAITPWKIKHIIDEKEWGESNSTVADFHNHDAAAGLMSGRATGSYAYDALILDRPELHFHAVGKIKVMEAIISFACEGRTLDLLQTHLLQTGTFEHDSSIKWFLELVEANKGVLEFKKAVNQIMDNAAFWPINVDKRKVVNIDEKSKTFTIVRENDKDTYLILINMSSFTQYDFKIPVPKRGKYKLLLNSDSFLFSGTGVASFESEFSSIQVDQFEFFNYGLNVSVVPPYSTLVWRKVDSQ